MSSQPQAQSHARTMVAPIQTASKSEDAGARASRSLSSTVSLGPVSTGAARSLLSNSVAKPAPATSPAPDATYLKAAFKIGSTHGRIDFDKEERVFHRSDVPLHARAAHAYVTRLLQTNLLSKQDRPWDISTSSGPAIRGSKHCSWETPADAWDNKLYHRIQSEHLVKTAKQRVDLIRAGGDPDFDPANLHERWNVSTLVEDRKPPLLSVQAEQGGEAAGQPRVIKHLPPDRKSLITLQTDLNLHTRAMKAAAAAHKAEVSSLEANWAQWRMAEHVDGSPTLPSLPIGPRDTGAIAQAVATEYPAEALRTFLWQQQNPEAAASAGLAPLQPVSPQAAHWKHAPRPTVHHVHRTERPLEKESLPYSSKVPPAWYRVEAKAAQVSQARAEAPFPRFAHPGSYSWVPSSSSSPSSSARVHEHKEWSHDDELAATGGFYRWTCCLHPLRDSRGCTAADTDPTRVRVVVARSDDPSSVAAMGLSSSKCYTRPPTELDASHVRSRSDAAAASLHPHAAPVFGGTSGQLGASSGMGLSGPGVAIVKRLEHTGRFEACAATREAMWSCCGAGDQKAPGCTSKTVTKEHRWQVDSA